MKGTLSYIESSEERKRRKTDEEYDAFAMIWFILSTVMTIAGGILIVIWGSPIVVIVCGGLAGMTILFGLHYRIKAKKLRRRESGEVCPACGVKASWLTGPRGGMAVNVKCASCHAKFNMTPFGMEEL